MNTRTLFLLLLFVIGSIKIAIAQENNISKKETIKAMKKAFIWQQEHPRHKLWDWTNGAYYAGISKAWESTKDKKYLKAMMAMANANNWDRGPRWYHADDYVINQTYIDIWKSKPKKANLEPTKRALDTVITTGGLSEKWKNDPMTQIHWWWCDALFMGPPTYVKYGVAVNDLSYLKASDVFYKEAYELLYNKEENLWARDIRYLWKGDKEYIKEPNGKKVFWSRGNGWVFGGLAILLEDMPKDYENRAFYETIFKQMAAKLKKIQPKDGLWRASLLDPDSHKYGESSGSGFYTFGLAWGIRNGILDKEEYLPVVKNAWKGLLRNQQENGMVAFVQPIGGAPSQEVDQTTWEVYGTGAFLLAGSEIIKLFP